MVTSQLKIYTLDTSTGKRIRLVCTCISSCNDLVIPPTSALKKLTRADKNCSIVAQLSVLICPS